MELLRLSTWDGPEIYRPDLNIQEYTSLIWTERYKTHGEFEMRHPNVADIRSKLPLGTLVSLQDTREVMMVESHQIIDNDDGIPELIVSGRSLTMMLENRVLSGPEKKRWKVPGHQTVGGMCARLIWNSLANNTAIDRVRPYSGSNPPPNDIFDTLNRVGVADESDRGLTQKRWWAQPGTVWDQFLLYASEQNLGLRTLRPPNYDRQRIYINSYGVLVETLGDSSNLLYEVYNGYDRSTNQTDRPPVIFREDQGHLENCEYLFSIKDWKNAISVHSEEFGSQWIMKPGQTSMGFGRRWTFLDAGSYGTFEDQTESNEALADQKSRGSQELWKRNKKSIFNAKVSATAPHIYKTHYGLGDTVTIKGDYGVEAHLIVTEHIRTEDTDGETGYPTLSSEE